MIEPPGGIGHGLLNVIMTDPSEEDDGGKGECCLIPLVTSIVPALDPTKSVLFIDPPEGLLGLDLGKETQTHFPDQPVSNFSLPLFSPRNNYQFFAELKPALSFFNTESSLNEDLQRLRSELESLVSSGSPGIIENMLPGKALLEQLGRHDLQKTIEEQGGHFQVAALLGYRPFRFPRGYWTAERIDSELCGFLESLWEAREGGLEVHALTGETRDPRLGDADQPPYLADGLLPNGEALLKYGRSDLVGAIRRNGGFKPIAKELGRTLWSSRSKKKKRMKFDS